MCSVTCRQTFDPTPYATCCSRCRTIGRSTRSDRTQRRLHTRYHRRAAALCQWKERIGPLAPHCRRQALRQHIGSPGAVQAQPHDADHAQQVRRREWAVIRPQQAQHLHIEWQVAAVSGQPCIDAVVVGL